MNVHVLLCVAYVPRLCNCAGGFKGDSQGSAPWNRGAGPLPANTQRVQGGPVSPTPPRVGNYPVTGATPPRVGGQPVTHSGLPNAGSSQLTLGLPNVGSSQPAPQSVQTERARIGQELTQHNVATLNLQHDLESFMGRDISVDTDKLDLNTVTLPGETVRNGGARVGPSTPPTKPGAPQNDAPETQSVAPPKNNAPYEEPGEENDVMHDHLPDEVVIQEVDLLQEENLPNDVMKGQTNGLVEEAARISQELIRRNTDTLELQNNLEGFVKRDLSPSKPLRDIEVIEEEPPEAHQNDVEVDSPFINKDFLANGSKPPKVLQDTEVIEEPLPKGTNLNGHTSDSWNLTDTSSITGIKKVQTAPPQTKATAVRHGLGSGPTTPTPSISFRPVSTNALMG